MFKRIGRATLALLGGVLITAATAVPAGAAPVTPGTARPAAGCVLMMQQPDDLTRTIPVKQVCDATEIRASGAVALARYYTDADFGGYNQDVYGYYGTCDKEGYTFSTGDYWSHNLSSYRVFPNCFWSTISTYWGTTRYGTAGDSSYVGDTWNDNTYTFRTWAR